MFLTFDQMITLLRETIQTFPDGRTGKNSFYAMEDVGYYKELYGDNDKTWISVHEYLLSIVFHAPAVL